MHPAAGIPIAAMLLAALVMGIFGTVAYQRVTGNESSNSTTTNTSSSSFGASSNGTVSAASTTCEIPELEGAVTGPWDATELADTTTPLDCGGSQVWMNGAIGADGLASGGSCQPYVNFSTFDVLTTLTEFEGDVSGLWDSLELAEITVATNCTPPHLCSITKDSKGRITALEEGPVALTNETEFGGDVTGTYDSLQLVEIGEATACSAPSWCGPAIDTAGRVTQLTIGPDVWLAADEVGGGASGPLSNVALNIVAGEYIMVTHHDDGAVEIGTTEPPFITETNWTSTLQPFRGYLNDTLCPHDFDTYISGYIYYYRQGSLSMLTVVFPSLPFDWNNVPFTCWDGEGPANNFRIDLSTLPQFSDMTLPVADAMPTSYIPTPSLTNVDPGSSIMPITVDSTGFLIIRLNWVGELTGSPSGRFSGNPTIVYAAPV